MVSLPDSIDIFVQYYYVKTQSKSYAKNKLTESFATQTIHMPPPILKKQQSFYSLYPLSVSFVREFFLGLVRAAYPVPAIYMISI